MQFYHIFHRFVMQSMFDETDTTFSSNRVVHTQYHSSSDPKRYTWYFSSTEQSVMSVCISKYSICDKTLQADSCVYPRFAFVLSHAAYVDNRR